MGLSAGSWSTSLHILSPVTRNLFQNAVLQSGAYTDHLIDGRPEDHIKKWLKMAELIGCNEDKSGKFDQKILECLRGVDPSKLVTVLDVPELKFQPVIAFTLVVVDGKFLPKNPSELLSSGDFKQNTNLMISTVVDEGSFILSLDNFYKDKFNMINPKNLSLKEAISELTEISSKLSNKLSINGKEVAKLYFTGIPDGNDFGLYRRTVGIAVGDYYLNCPTILFAKEFFRNSGFKTNIFQYYFNVKFGQMPDWFGSSHGEDSSPTHGIPFIDKETSSDEDRQISEKMIQMFTDFAKYGLVFMFFKLLQIFSKML